ncbi:hypothetical protein ACLOJK_002388 [Asimina triloba]
MSCLSRDRRFSRAEMPCSCVVLEEEEEKFSEKLSPWKRPEYRLEKIFPVYAMSSLSLEDASRAAASAADNSVESSADPIWDAMRAETKSEVFVFELDYVELLCRKLSFVAASVDGMDAIVFLPA